MRGLHRDHIGGVVPHHHGLSESFLPNITSCISRLRGFASTEDLDGMVKAINKGHFHQVSGTIMDILAQCDYGLSRPEVDRYIGRLGPEISGQYNKKLTTDRNTIAKVLDDWQKEMNNSGGIFNVTQIVYGRIARNNWPGIQVSAR